MIRIYTPTEEELVTLPTERKCTRCHQTKPRTDFSITTRVNAAHRYFVLRPSCKRCEALARRKLATRASERKIYSQIAPLAAAKKLIEQNPEALALLIQRFRTQYVILLDAEREKMLNTRKAIKEAAIAARGLYSEDQNSSASSH